MLQSLALMLLLGLLLGKLCKTIGLPPLTGMIFTGIILGPYCTDLIDPSVLSISSELRRIALLIILLRAGLSLNVEDLKKVGRPAFLMCFIPACFEICGMILIAPKLLGLSILEAALLGSVIAAVSPAVIVPSMIKLMNKGYGIEKGVPQLILAGASVDDVFVIVLFSAFTGLASGEEVSVLKFINIPVSIFTGALLGILIGLIIHRIFTRFSIRLTKKAILLLSVAFLLSSAEDQWPYLLGFSSLIAVMAMGITLEEKNKPLAVNLSAKFNKLWIGAELLLFILVGATVDPSYALASGPKVLLLIPAILLFRVTGVGLCLLGTDFTKKERLFCMIGYLPKATVQAAIGGIPLSMGLGCGSIILTVAVLAILITAPVGAFLINLTYKKLLTRTRSA